MLARRGVAAVLAGTVTLVPVAVHAQHLRDWTHDHSSKGVPYRPKGYADLVRVFGKACNGRANDARTHFPHINGRWDGGYVYYHPYLSRNVGYNIRTHIRADHRDGALDYGEYGYNCRRMRGSSNWSTHAFGAAIDTNTKRNPAGQSYWNGKGANGVDYGYYVPNVFRGGYPGHRFRWGLSWRDPHHFQYVTDY
ncbi:MAG TPA: M15 family metallopeptidase [Actinomycetota bacterium]|jgi:hypothetical protein|nr:M15 family metallopeptidase [Actinomycetota bacterium]